MKTELMNKIEEKKFQEKKEYIVKMDEVEQKFSISTYYL